MGSRSPAPSGTVKGACRCTPCAPTSITDSPKRRPRTASSVSRCGFSRARSWPRTTRRRLLPTRLRQHRRPSRRPRARPARRPQEQEHDVLQPARRKFRKEQKGRNTGKATRGNKVSFGEYGLKAIGRGRLTARQIEAARRAMTRHIKRGGRIWIRIFPDKPISQKPAEVRMGNGKGNPEYWVAEIQPGKMLYEMDGVDEPTAKEAFRLAAAKLPIATSFVQRMVGA